MIPPRLVAATGNAHKVDELRALFLHHGVIVDILPITSLVDSFEVDESGATFEENALIKALAGYGMCHLPVIADDSGLEVDALDGAPGVISARYSGAGATDASNRSKLLHELARNPQRSARFRCVLAIHDGVRSVMAEGSCEGSIAHEERGLLGFGYDSLFIPRGFDQTFGEVDAAIKHLHSHRAAAVAALVKRWTTDPTPQVTDVADFLLDAVIATATGNEAALRFAVAYAVNVEDYLALYEAILQTYLFCGFPAALEALATLESCVMERGFTTSLVAHEPYEVETFRTRGEILCRRIYGSVYDRMMERLDGVSPELREWMIIEGYGKTLSRGALSVVARECCIVAVLACTRRTTQLVSHVRGALAVGASVDHIHGVIDALQRHGLARESLLLDDVLGRFE